MRGVGNNSSAGRIGEDEEAEVFSCGSDYIGPVRRGVGSVPEPAGPMVYGYSSSLPALRRFTSALSASTSRFRASSSDEAGSLSSTTPASASS
jgi:hypothetical protein